MLVGILLACLDHGFPLNTSLVQIPALIKKSPPPKKKTTTTQRRQKPCNNHPHTFSNNRLPRTSTGSSTGASSLSFRDPRPCRPAVPGRFLPFLLLELFSLRRLDRSLDFFLDLERDASSRSPATTTNEEQKKSKYNGQKKTHAHTTVAHLAKTKTPHCRNNLRSGSSP